MLSTLKSIAIAAVLALAICSCNQKENNSSNNETELAEAKVKAPKITIHDAVIAGDLEAVKQHIAAKSDINKKDPFGGSSPLIIATVFDKPEIAKVLIEAGANLNQKNNDGSTPLHSAAFFCRTETVQDLLNAGADKALKNNFNVTALESMQAPFSEVKGIYEMMGAQLAPMGLKLDLEQIEKTRPQIAEMLK